MLLMEDYAGENISPLGNWLNLNRAATRYNNCVDEASLFPVQQSVCAGPKTTLGYDSASLSKLMLNIAEPC